MYKNVFVLFHKHLCDKFKAHEDEARCVPVIRNALCLKILVTHAFFVLYLFVGITLLTCNRLGLFECSIYCSFILIGLVKAHKCMEVNLVLFSQISGENIAGKIKAVREKIQAACERVSFLKLHIYFQLPFHFAPYTKLHSIMETMACFFVHCTLQFIALIFFFVYFIHDDSIMFHKMINGMGKRM